MTTFKHTLKRAWRITVAIWAILFLIVALVNLTEDGLEAWDCLEKLLAGARVSSLPRTAGPFGTSVLFTSEAVSAALHRLQSAVKYLSKLGR